MGRRELMGLESPEDASRGIRYYEAGWRWAMLGHREPGLSPLHPFRQGWEDGWDTVMSHIPVEQWD